MVIWGIAERLEQCDEKIMIFNVRHFLMMIEKQFSCFYNCSTFGIPFIKIQLSGEEGEGEGGEKQKKKEGREKKGRNRGKEEIEEKRKGEKSEKEKRQERNERENKVTEKRKRKEGNKEQKRDSTFQLEFGQQTSKWGKQCPLFSLHHPIIHYCSPFYVFLQCYIRTKRQYTQIFNCTNICVLAA